MVIDPASWEAKLGCQSCWVCWPVAVPGRKDRSVFQAGRLKRTHTMVLGSPLSFGFPSRPSGWCEDAMLCRQNQGSPTAASEAECVSVTSSESSAGENTRVLPTCVARGVGSPAGRACGGLMSPAGTGLGCCCW